MQPEEQGSRRLVALLLAVIPFSQIPLDAYTPALPDMVRDLHSTPGIMQSTVTAYMLGMSGALIPVGLLSDWIGRKPVLIAGMALLVLMSLACGTARGADFLLVARFVQGIGGCTCLVVTYAIAADRFRGARLTALSGLLGAAWGLAPVFAPAAGGLVVQYISWQGIFGAIALLALIVLVLALLWLPETLAPEKRRPIRLGATATTIREALRHPRFLAFTLFFGAIASAQMVFGVVAPFLYQKLLHFTPALYGLVALLLGAVNLLGELACSAFAQRIRPGPLAAAGLLPFLVGAGLLAVTGLLTGAGFAAITTGGALVLAGAGLLCPMMYGMALGLFERDLGLLGGLVSALCYIIVSATMGIAALLPDRSQLPLGLLYLMLGLVAGALLLWGMTRRLSLARAD